MKKLLSDILRRYNKWRGTLQASLISSIILLWVVPYIAIVSMAVYLIYDMQQSKLIDTVLISTESAADICSARIHDAMNSSLSASYTPTLRKHYDDKLKFGIGFGKADVHISNFITEQYKYDEKFNLTVLFYTCDPDTLYYTFSNTLAATYKDIGEFKSGALPIADSMHEELGTDFGFFSVGSKVYMLRNLFLSNYEPYAVLIMELNQPSIFGSIDGVAWQNSTIVAIDDCLRVTGSEDYSALLPSESFSGCRSFKSGGSYYVQCRTSVANSLDLSAVIKLDPDPLSGQYGGLIILLIVLFFMLIPMILSLAAIINNKIVRPINRLVRASLRIEKGEWGYVIDKEPGSFEFEYLTDAFNHMSSQLGAQVEKMYAEELALRDARIMALQSQINPHFLNNTLEIINWEARLGDTLKVSRMLEALGTMLEAALDRKRRPVVHLSEELVYVDAYLYIISERFGKRLEVEKNIDGSLLDVMVPRLVLQPILENAVEHGVAPRHHGRIVIDIHSEGGYIYINVFNEGALSEENAQRIKSLLYGSAVDRSERSINLGIRNVNERIKIICGEDCGLDITSTEDNMTLSTIKLRSDIDMPM